MRGLASAILGISEAKQVGPLYHFTSAYAAVAILRANTISAGQNGLVSLTRDRNFLHARPQGNTGMSGDIHVAFVLDGDKISQRTKIQPHSAKGFSDEQEERVKGDLKGLRGCDSQGFRGLAEDGSRS